MESRRQLPPASTRRRPGPRSRPRHVPSIGDALTGRRAPGPCPLEGVVGSRARRRPTLADEPEVVDDRLDSRRRSGRPGRKTPARSTARPRPGGELGRPGGTSVRIRSAPERSDDCQRSAPGPGPGKRPPRGWSPRLGMERSRVRWVWADRSRVPGVRTGAGGLASTAWPDVGDDQLLPSTDPDRSRLAGAAPNSGPTRTTVDSPRQPGDAECDRVGRRAPVESPALSRRARPAVGGSRCARA